MNNDLDKDLRICAEICGWQRAPNKNNTGFYWCRLDKKGVRTGLPYFLTGTGLLELHDKMREDGWDIAMDTLADENSEWVWLKKVTEDGVKPYEATAKTLPEAMVKACAKTRAGDEQR